MRQAGQETSRYENILDKFLNEGSLTEFSIQIKKIYLNQNQQISFLTKFSQGYHKKCIQLTNLTTELQRKYSEIQILNSKISEQQFYISNLDQGNKQIISKLEIESQRQQREINSLEKALKEKENIIHQKELQISEYHPKIQNYENLQKTLTNEKLDLTNNLHTQSTELQSSLNQNKILTKQIEQLQQDLQLLQTQHEKTLNNLKQRTAKQIKNNEIQIQEFQLQFIKQEGELKQRNKQMEDLEKQLDQIIKSGVAVQQQIKSKKKVEDLNNHRNNIKNTLNQIEIFLLKIQQKQNSHNELERAQLQQWYTYTNYLKKVLNKIDNLIQEIIKDYESLDGQALIILKNYTEEEVKKIFTQNFNSLMFELFNQFSINNDTFYKGVCTIMPRQEKIKSDSLIQNLMDQNFYQQEIIRNGSRDIEFNLQIGESNQLRILQTVSSLPTSTNQIIANFIKNNQQVISQIKKRMENLRI